MPSFTVMFTGQSDLGNSSQMTLDCVQLTVKANQGTQDMILDSLPLGQNPMEMLSS